MAGREIQDGRGTTDLLAEMEQARQLAARYQFEFVDLRDSHPDGELLRTIPLELMVRYQFLPLGTHDHRLEIAVGEPRRTWRGSTSWR